MRSKHKSWTISKKIAQFGGGTAAPIRNSGQKCVSQPKATKNDQISAKIRNKQTKITQSLAGSSIAAKGGFEKPQLQSDNYYLYIITVLNQL